MGVLTLPLAIFLAEAAALSAPPTGTHVMEDVSVTADEPRFVAPTRRDRIGRIWAPVTVNGKGPFRLVLDTGASHSALTAGVVEELGITLDPAQTVMLRGATGSLEAQLVPIESLEVGDLLMEPKRLPIVPDALGGAEGILGTDGTREQAHPYRLPARQHHDHALEKRARHERLRDHPGQVHAWAVTGR